MLHDHYELKDFSLLRHTR